MPDSVLKYPYPYKAWLTMANDPDNTVIEDWRELHQFIWEELKLPFGDSLFVRSFNQNLPAQVNLMDHPEIAQAHLHDIIHTWGDYMHGRKRGFDREDAEEARLLLKEKGISPRVWIDHASFVGNMLHGTKKGSMPSLKDSSGHVYENFLYTLDLAQKIGVRYIWNGDVIPTVGQDRELNFNDLERLHGGSSLKAAVRSTLQKLPSESGVFARSDNRQYYKKQFPDGSNMYCFRRYGTWKDADISGLYNVIKPALIDELIQNEGTSIVYTHLGKRQLKDMQNAQHIPEQTRAALQNVSNQFASKQLMVSSVSEMLDYLVIRDHIKVDSDKGGIDFISDGIRYADLSKTDLRGKKFSFRAKGFDSEKILIRIDDKPTPCRVEKESKAVFSVCFD